MRSPADMDTIQIEITNACKLQCANCTRFCGHHEQPYFMPFDQFKKYIDIQAGYHNMTGIMGGEPLLHPEFEKFCQYAVSKIPRKQLGLWTAFPPGKEHFRELICATFGNIFLNDHERGDIFHQPLLVGAKECMSREEQMFYLIDKCWVQNSWSASLNPNGAFFCEVAAAWSLLLGETPETAKAWKPEPNWWWRTPKDFKEQIEHYCPRCGGAMPLRRRASVDRIDDISPDNFELLKDRSRKIKKGQYKLHDCGVVQKQEQLAAYKDPVFRDRIAKRYNIYLSVNEKGFNEPFLLKQPLTFKASLFYRLKEEWENRI